jgi:hypothetical protein
MTVITLLLLLAQEMTSVEPIRCWWQSSTGAITIGESFDVTLTCAVLDTAAVQVVPDESRLGVASIQVAPFEILGGSHPPDAHRGPRRFFQYRYSLRLINADSIGRDVNVPVLPIQYRVHSRMGANASLEGRDLTYLLPALPIKVLSLVPADAADIRDGTDASLGAVESLRFRTNLLEILALSLGAIAAVVALLALLPLTRRARTVGKADEGRLPDRIVLHHVAAELDDVKREAAIEGWSDAITARALAALRIVAACAIDRASSQKPLAPGAPVPEGRLAAAHGWPRPMRVSVSSPVTMDDVGRAGSKLADSVSMTRRHHLEGLQQGIAVLTAGLYRQAPVRDSQVLDEAVRHGASVARDLEQERASWITLWRTLWSRP